MFYNVHTDGKWLVLFELELALCDVGVRLGGEVINHQVVQWYYLTTNPTSDINNTTIDLVVLLRRYSITVLKSVLLCKYDQV